MQNISVNLIVVYFLLVNLKGCGCQNSYCNQAQQEHRNRQVLEICTDHTSTEDTIILLDTYKVYKSKETICECNILFNDIEDTFYFDIFNSNIARGMSFKINDQLVLNQTIKSESTILSDASTLKMSTSSNFKNGGACLIVKSENIHFVIKCVQGEMNESLTTTQGHIENTDTVNVIIPATVASLCAACLILVVTLIIFCKRRYTNKSSLFDTSTLSESHEEQRDRHDADNPVFDMTETQSRDRTSEHEYNYIDHYQFGGNQYNTLSEQHYNCVTNQNNKCNRVIGDDMYDTTTGIVSQHKPEADDYHHLGAVNTRTANVNEYNTVNIEKQ